MTTIATKLLTKAAILPTRGTPNSAGFDLYCPNGAQYLIQAGDIVKIPTNISMAIPSGYYGQIACRSSLAAKFGATILGGVIDADYRGEIIVMVRAKDTFMINGGDRFAQLIPIKICPADLIIVDTLDVTERGEGGFGSTDKK
jgi:dUTP pyrophosphatase